MAGEKTSSSVSCHLNLPGMAGEKLIYSVLSHLLSMVSDTSSLLNLKTKFCNTFTSPLALVYFSSTDEVLQDKSVMANTRQIYKRERMRWRIREQITNI